MKKLLALVLALVMSMSLVTISNAAFKDADKIDYKEAVDVMNAVGVFVGDEKGNFNAKDNLTREQAAKIIAYLELGSKAADALVGGATFTDVASTRWSAGFVGYCAQAGIVSGVGDSKFDPAGQLTALQFGKMLLVELGYDAKAEGMVGTDWAINTSKLMASTKLMDKIDGSVNQVLTREKAAQMCVNALKAPTVEYSTKGSSITVNGAEINFGASVPTYVTNTIAKEQTISKQTLTNSNAYTIELGEKLFKDLKLNRTADDFGRPANEWFWKAAKVGTYADKADLSYTEKVKLGTIYSDLGLGEKVLAKNVTVYVDGDKGTLAKDISKGEDTKIGGQGTLTEVYYDSGDNTAVICHINYYIDVTTQKARLSEAKAVAKDLVAAYQHSTIVDTVLCLDGTQVIGTCLANELTKDGFANMNAHQTIYVITPEYTTGSQIILRDNLAPMVKGKHVLILAASITTGYTVQAAVEAVNYYGGMVAGLSAIFATTHECMGYPVTSIFDPASLPDYASFDSRDCPMCKAGQHIDALVNSFGYSAL